MLGNICLSRVFEARGRENADVFRLKSGFYWSQNAVDRLREWLRPERTLPN